MAMGESALGLLWMAPALSGGGYASEAIAFAQGLENVLGNRFALRQFAEPASLSDDDLATHPHMKLLRRVMRLADARGAGSGIVVCHSTPDAWVPSKFPGWDAVAPCPPPRARFAIGRTMFETDGLPKGWAERCNTMDEIWVPTSEAAENFARAGVDAGKIVVIGEPVDSAFFDPTKYAPLELPPLLGQAAAAAAPYRFLAVFKWEARKGWDVLLRAYWAEFEANERVELVLKTTPFHSSGDFEGLIADFVRVSGLPARRAPVRILGHDVAAAALPSLYRTADCFVLPSRGEGWGRPHVEAMAMALPVIATNATGPTAFLDETVGYPLDATRVPVPDEMQLPGHTWAEPSVKHLRALMRHVYTEPEEARARGARARERMAKAFSPAALAAEVEGHLTRIARTLSEREQGDGRADKGIGKAEAKAKVKRHGQRDEL